MSSQEGQDQKILSQDISPLQIPLKRYPSISIVIPYFFSSVHQTRLCETPVFPWRIIVLHVLMLYTMSFRSPMRRGSRSPWMKIFPGWANITAYTASNDFNFALLMWYFFCIKYLFGVNFLNFSPLDLQFMSICCFVFLFKFFSFVNLFQSVLRQYHCEEWAFQDKTA